jgi:hypothetical protein
LEGKDHDNYNRKPRTCAQNHHDQESYRQGGHHQVEQQATGSLGRRGLYLIAQPLAAQADDGSATVQRQAEMKYMLDTNVLMHIVNFNTGYRRIIKHIQRTEKADMVLSAVSYFELTSKIMAAKLGKDKAETLAELVAQFKVMPYSGVDSVIVNMS